MLSSSIKFEQNKYIVKIFNDETKEETKSEFSELLDATNYVLHFEEDYYDFKFNKLVFSLNYERFKLIIENQSNPSEELADKIKIANELFNRAVIESNYYFYVACKENPGIVKDICGMSVDELDNISLSDIDDYFINEIDF